MRDILYINVEKHLETRILKYPAVEREKKIFRKGNIKLGKKIHEKLHLH